MKRTLVIALAVIIIATAAWCQGGPGGPGGPKGPAPSAMAVLLPPPAGAVDQITKALSLTTTQAADLKTALTASDATIQPLLKAAGDSAKALRDAVFAGGTADQITQLTADAQQAELAVIEASVNTWGQIKSILTADQFAKLAAGPGAPPPPPTNGGGSGSVGTGTTGGRRR